MRVCFYGNFTQPYCSENHHALTLESLGHEVIRLQEGGNSLDRLRRKALTSDLLVWVHSHGIQHRGMVGMPEILAELRQHHIPSVAFHLDLFMAIPDRWKEYQSDPYIRGLDYFFSVDGPLVDWLNIHTDVKAHYLPAGVLESECYRATPKNPFEVAFVGSKRYHPEWQMRPRLIDWLHTTYGNRFQHFGQDAQPIGRVVRGPELNQTYADAKVVVGDSFCPGFTYGPYWSDRVYETLGRGGFLIHPRCPGIEAEFVEDNELVLYEYGNFTQLKAKIDYYLANPQEREQIQQAGHERVKGNYTYRHRWEHILNTVFSTADPVDLGKVQDAVEVVLGRKVKARQLIRSPHIIELELQ